MKPGKTQSGLPRVLLRDAQVLAAVSIGFSLVGGTLQELHRSVGVSQLQTVATQITSNLVVSAVTVGTVLAFTVATQRETPRGLGRAWRAERPYPWWIGALGGAIGGAAAALTVRAASPGWLMAASAGWMLMATLLVQAITRGARRIEVQSARLADTVADLQDSRSQLIRADVALRQSIAEQLHGSAQGELLAIERHLREDARGHEADRIAAFRTGTIRDLAHRLHPGIVEVGLLPALDELAARAPVPCAVTASTAAMQLDDLGSGLIDMTTRLALYRTCEEAINNAVSAGATEISVDLTVEAGRLRMGVRDNGSGVTGEPRVGLGLRTVDAWLAGVGGTWQLASHDDGAAGAMLCAHVPVT